MPEANSEGALNDQPDIKRGKEVTEKIIEAIGIDLLQCGLRIYRRLQDYYIERKEPNDFKKGLIDVTRAFRNYIGLNESSMSKSEEAKRFVMDQCIKGNDAELQKEIERYTKILSDQEVIEKAISYVEVDPDLNYEDFYRKLDFSEQTFPQHRVPDYPLYYLIQFLCTHLKETSLARKKGTPPYAKIGEFLFEQDIKSYDFDGERIALKSKDITAYFENEGIMKGMSTFYNECRFNYSAPITTPIFQRPNQEKYSIETAVNAEQSLLVYCERQNVSEKALCHHFFPSLEDMLFLPKE
jgi:hypothetical protein